MDKILGFDLGTNSIGAALRAGNEFEWFGVTTFKKGVGNGKSGEFSYAAERTKHRSSRRLYNARRYRKWETLKVLIENGYCPLAMEELIKWKNYKKGVGRVFPLSNSDFNNWIKLDFNGNGRSDYSSPYQLRKELIETKLDLSKEENRYKIGRAFYHIAQRRGFKSSRKGGDKEKSTVYKGGGDTTAIGVNEYLDLLETYKTLGAAFAYLENTGNRVRNRYTLRKHYEEEVINICEKQGLSNELSSQISKAIFYQRPLKSQKGTIGKCTLEPNKPRCPISHPKYEKFRALQFINNIKYRESEDHLWKQLPLDLRNRLYEDKFLLLSTSIKFGDIRKYIEKAGIKYELNYKSKADKVSVSACPVSGRLKSVFGENWVNWRQVNEVTDRQGKRREYNIWDIWHILFSFEDEEYFTQFCLSDLQLTEDQTESLIILWKSFPVGYANLSLKAINNILRFLEEGLIYTEAALLAKIPEVIGSELFEDNRKELIEAIKSEIEKNRHQKTIINITNRLISQYYLLPYEARFAWKDFKYTLDEDDINEIHNAASSHFGSKRWEGIAEEERKQIIESVKFEYQAFFSDHKREHRKQPHLLNQIKDFLIKSNLVEDGKNLDKLYHPSQIEIYAPVNEAEDGNKYLDSPSKNNGAFKNPMAMRTMHELRRITNDLIRAGKIDEETRIVVEVARELNDANRRWAIEKWQRDRERENESFAFAISELKNESNFTGSANPDNQKDRQKFRLWTEQIIDADKVNETIKEIDNDKKLNVTDKEIKKYRLWKEQNCQCIYTGKQIRLSDLFNSNIIDFEHTVPRSKSFDNSLANQTVAYSDYNRNIKKTKLPIELPNYLEDTKEGTAIEPRLEAWKKKVEILEERLANYKLSSKYAADKDKKDTAIRQKHLVQFELDYWKDKIDRFERVDIPLGFKHSQLIDTQIISKYAFHYLKSVFRKVDVQKGSVTAEFRKIYGIQEKIDKKDRSKHHHHAVDAAVLTLIPPATEREEILKYSYQFAEENLGKQYTKLPFEGFRHSLIKSLENTILINNTPPKDQVLSPAKKNVRRRGKIVFLRDKKGNYLRDEKGQKIIKQANGDSIRGQLHQDTFYGKIKIAKKENGSLVRDEKGQIIYEQKDGRDVIWVVKRVLTSDNGFNAENIVDDILREFVKKQLKHKKPTELVDFNNKPIRHIRCRVKSGRGYMNPDNLTEVKEQVYKSKKEYKNYIYADSGDNYVFGMYETDNGKRELKSVNVIEAAKINSLNHIQSIEELFEPTMEIGNKKEQAKLIHIFREGQKVIFFINDKNELKELSRDELSKRLYFVKRLHQASVGNIQFQHHLEARTDEELSKDYPSQIFKSAGKDGFSKFQTDFVAPRLLFKPIKDIFIIEGKDFVFNMDGSINFLF